MSPLLDLVLCGAGFGLAFVAYRLKSRPLGGLAGLVGATVAAGVLLLGPFVFPLLYWIWRRNPGQGYGWMLTLSMALSTWLLYYRLPKPADQPAGSTQTTTAIVRSLHRRTHVWGTYRSSGQEIPVAYDEVDLELNPGGQSVPLHAIDRVDAGSVPGLALGATVRVRYAVADPERARIDGGDRTYPNAALQYLLKLTAIFGAIVLGLGWAWQRVTGWFRRPGSLGSVRTDPTQAMQRLSALPPDHPARKRFEEWQRKREGGSPPC